MPGIPVVKFELELICTVIITLNKKKNWEIPVGFRFSDRMPAGIGGGV
jgi:hypothetical protein